MTQFLIHSVLIDLFKKSVSQGIVNFVISCYYLICNIFVQQHTYFINNYLGFHG